MPEEVKPAANSDEKSAVFKDVTYRYSTSWIRSLETETHWRLYWRQHKIMQGLVLPGQHVLEIGSGSGFTANYLRSKGVKVTTIDIDAEKKPNIVANVVAYNFQESYDHVLGFEIFEHIPFEEFRTLLDELARVCKGYLFMSVPRNERVWFRCVLKLPKLGERSLELTTARGRIADRHHFWEVDHGEITASKLERVFSLADFTLAHKEKAFSRLFYVLKSPIT